MPSRSFGPINMITRSTCGSSAYRVANSKCAPVNGLNPPGKSTVILFIMYFFLYKYYLIGVAGAIIAPPVTLLVRYTKFFIFTTLLVLPAAD
jgi:hypothetical protein